DAEFNVLVQVGNFRSGLGSVHFVRRYPVPQPLEHVAGLIQSRRNGMATVALQAELSGERRNRLPRLWSQNSVTQGRQNRHERKEPGLYSRLSHGRIRSTLTAN